MTEPRGRAKISRTLIVGIFAAIACLLFASVPASTSVASTTKPPFEWSVKVSLIEVPYQNKMVLIFNGLQKAIQEAQKGSTVTVNFTELFTQCATLRNLRTDRNAVALEKGPSDVGDKIYTKWIKTTLTVGTDCEVSLNKPSTSAVQTLIGAVLTQNQADVKLINFLPKSLRPT